MEIASALLAEPPQIAMSALAIGHTVNAICADSLRPGGIGATSASIVRVDRDRPIPLFPGVLASTLSAAIQSVIARLITRVVTRVPFPLHTVFTNVMARALGPSPH